MACFGFSVIDGTKLNKKMLRLMLQSGHYFLILFKNSKSAAYKQERLQIAYDGARTVFGSDW
jgi:hypothetical protein